MKHITDLLIEKGYKPYGQAGRSKNQNADAKNQNDWILKNRNDLIFLKGNKYSENSMYLYPKPKNEISTMLVGGIYVIYMKDNNYKNRIIWGLNEAKKPPTLIHPRPKINVKTYKDNKLINRINELCDDAMNECLRNETPEDIFKAMFNKSIIFNYETIK